MEHLQWGWVAWPWGHARLRDCCSVHQRNRRKAFPSGATGKEISAEEKLHVFVCVNQKIWLSTGRTGSCQFALLHEISKKANYSQVPFKRQSRLVQQERRYLLRKNYMFSYASIRKYGWALGALDLANLICFMRSARKQATLWFHLEDTVILIGTFL